MEARGACEADAFKRVTEQQRVFGLVWLPLCKALDFRNVLPAFFGEVPIDRRGKLIPWLKKNGSGEVMIKAGSGTATYHLRLVGHESSSSWENLAPRDVVGVKTRLGKRLDEIDAVLR